MKKPIVVIHIEAGGNERIYNINDRTQDAISLVYEAINYLISIKKELEGQRYPRKS